jgi:hypothetical protein
VCIKSIITTGENFFMNVSEIVDNQHVMCIYYNSVTGKTEEEQFPIAILVKHGK